MINYKYVDTIINHSTILGLTYLTKYKQLYKIVTSLTKYVLEQNIVSYVLIKSICVLVFLELQYLSSF